jgi:hypothetical protein
VRVPLVEARRGRGADPDWKDAVFVQTSEAEVGRALRTGAPERNALTVRLTTRG